MKRARRLARFLLVKGIRNRVKIEVDVKTKELTMISEDTAKKLHDKFSRGKALSTKEQKQLEDWYARQDAAESRMFTAPSKEKDASLLQKQVEAALYRLTTVTKHIQDVEIENKSLRREIASLRRRIMQQVRAQPA